MTKDEALKRALEALEDIASGRTYDPWTNGAIAQHIAEDAITAIKQALAAPVQDEQQPVQEPVQTTGETNVELDFYSDATGNGQQRQLVGEMEMGQLMGGRPHKSVGNPDAKGAVAVIKGVGEHGPMLVWYKHWISFPIGTQFYTTPPAAPVQEPAFHGFMDKENCCVNLCFTPHAPGGPNNELATAYYTTPLAAQRQAQDKPAAWVGLTQQDIDIAFDDTREGGGFDDFARAIEAVLKEKNT